MDIHKNARLTPRSRAVLVRRIVHEGQIPKAVATAFGVCEKTVRKWVVRLLQEGEPGLSDRSSRPHRVRKPTPSGIALEIEVLRRQRITAQQIARQLKVSPATVRRVLKRLGLNKLKALEPAEPVRRYEREHPGELIHVDIKKLGKFSTTGHRIAGDRRNCRTYGAGYEFVHVAIDDASRLAFSKILPDEKRESATAFLEAAVAYYRGPESR